MAKIHKNAEKFPIQWDGTVEGGEKEGDSIPSSINIKWGSGRQVPYTACWDDGNGGVDTSQCTGNLDDYFFEDFGFLGCVGFDFSFSFIALKNVPLTPP